MSEQKTTKTPENICKNRILILRKKHGLTQAELAARCDMKQPMLNRVEKNASNLTVQNAIKISSVLGEPLEELWEETFNEKETKNGFNFLGMLNDWQLMELRNAVDAELLKRIKNKI